MVVSLWRPVSSGVSKYSLLCNWTAGSKVTFLRPMEGTSTVGTRNHKKRSRTRVLGFEPHWLIVVIRHILNPGQSGGPCLQPRLFIYIRQLNLKRPVRLELRLEVLSCPNLVSLRLLEPSFILSEF